MHRIAKILFLLLGVGLLTVVLQKADLGQIVEQVSALSISGLLLVFVVYAAYFGADALSWQITLPAMPLTLRWAGRAYVVRMIGEAYNNITPTASLGGEPIKAWLLKANWGIPLRESAASLVIAKTTSMCSLVVFVAVGTGFLVFEPAVGPAHKRVALAGLATIIVFTIVFFLMQRLRLSSRVALGLGRSRLGQRLAGLISGLEEVDALFAHFYASHRGRFAWSLVCAMFNWILGVVEVYLIMHLIGYPATFAEAWMIECLVQLVRTATFFIPAGIGSQEGAFLLAAGALTGNPSIGLATALVRRFRDFVWIALSLAVASLYPAKASGADATI